MAVAAVDPAEEVGPGGTDYMVDIAYRSASYPQTSQPNMHGALPATVFFGLPNDPQ